MGKRAMLWLAVLVVLAGGWAFYELAVYASRGGEHTPLYSVRRYDPYGTAALHRLLVERGQAVSLLERPRLDDGASGVLLQTLPMPRRERRTSVGSDVYALPTSHMADWIAEGNTVVQLTRHRTELMRELGVPRPTDAWADGEGYEAIEHHQRRGGLPSEQPIPRTPAASVDEDDDRRMMLRGPVYWSADAADESDESTDEADGEAGRWTPLWRSGERVVVGEVRHGEGRLVVVGSPTLVLNDGLEQADNLAVVLELLGDQPVIFDEWSHGVGHIGTVMGLIRGFGLMPVVGQILLIMVVYHWGTRGRWRAELAGPPRSRSSVEQVQTLGRLYSEALGLEDTTRRTVAEVYRRLGQAWRCEPQRLRERGGRRIDPLDDQMLALLDRADAIVDRMQAGAAGKANVVERELAALLNESHELIRKRKRG
ncbi:DUF4350 domain-containing protein [Phycisphaerales bacterium AB-hyl4]|uniref:DUF4350 domain-containing protein n=1 Tax=Natronomicrosphaera hydrolytica TaxID=3242702 RepID=A0ABV4UAS7_9BACT